jgi:tetratricopeptide (TPR) repeat protein
MTRDILSTHPGDSRALYNMGRCHLVRRELSEAFKEFNALIQISGNSRSRGYAGLADVSQTQGHYREAESYLSDGIELDRRANNHFSEVIKMIALASAYLDEGKLDKFTSVINELPSSSHSPLILFLAGCLQARAKQISKAEMMLHTLRSPGDKFTTPKVQSYISLLTAEIEISRGNYQVAINAAREALAVDNSTVGIEILARAYRAAGKFADSIREYEKVLTRPNERTEDGDGLCFHRVVEANFWLGILYAKTGDLHSSLKYLASFLDYWPEPDSDAPLYRDGRSMIQKVQHGATGKPTPAV